MRSALAPWLETQRGARIAITGECRERTVSPHQAQAMVLAFHELTTNATKYGALAVPEGRCAFRCDREPDGPVVLDWQEAGGPVATRPPDRRGFGTRLLN